MRRAQLSARFGLAAILLLQLPLTGCPSGTGVGAGDTGSLFNLPPTVVMSADVVRGVAPLTVRFNSSASTDDGVIVGRLWDFGDGQTSQDIAPTHIFRTTGAFTVRLTLTDDEGGKASRSLLISVTERPVARFKVLFNGEERYTAENAPARFDFDASESYDPDAEEGDKLLYRWDFGDGSREVIATVPHVFATPGTYRVVLTVTDAVGVTGTAEQVIEVGIPQPDIRFRSPPADIPVIVCSPTSPLWLHAWFQSEPGVPRFMRAGLDDDRDPGNGNDIQLDTDPPSGNDMNLTVPTALKLSGVSYDVFGRSYFLWAEIDTDRTSPRRAYSTNADQVVTVTPPFTSTITNTTPSVFLRQIGEAAVLMPATASRMIFDLGELRVGDRLHLSLLSTPGYGATYFQTGYSVMILDAQQKLYACYQDGNVLFSRNSKLVIGHFSPSYYVVVDVQGVGAYRQIPSVKVAVEPDAFPDSQPRRQYVYLNFNGATDLTVANSDPFTIPPLTVTGLNDQLLRSAILTRVQDLFQPYDFMISTSPPTEPAQPFQTIYFDGVGTLLTDGGKSSGDLQFYGLANFVDPRNETLTGRAVISVTEIRNDFPGLANEQDLGITIGNTVAHQIGLLSGLRETTGNLSDIMTSNSSRANITNLGFTIADLAASGGLTAIGTQGAPLLLEELFRK